MGLVCFGLSHRHVPIAIRERVYFDSDSIANACARFRCGTDRLSNLLEFILLSTCNRTEVYAFTTEENPLAIGDAVKREILEFVAQAREISVDELSRWGRWVESPDVPAHLCRVACGLESLVLGEPQILGQVGDAMRMALAMNSAGSVLSKMFQTAIRAGRRARLETQIGQHSMNISTVAVNTAESELGSLQGKNVVVLGAGEMADLALRQLRDKGAEKILVVNRTLEKAKELSARHDGQPFVFEQITRLLPEADVLITSTGAPHTLIDREMMAYTIGRRPERKLVILDIAVPRDVDPQVDSIPGVVRCDIDHLHISSGHSAAIRESQVPDVESIVDREVHAYLNWLRSVGVESIVAGLRQKAEDIRQKELQRLAQLLPKQSDESWKAIEGFAKSLVNKLLHYPTVGLREQHGTRGAIDYAEAMRQLFRLEMEYGEPEESKALV